MLKNTFTDISQGIANYRIWIALGLQDIKLKYRRSTLGPFWITLSMAITIGVLGPLYGGLFTHSLSDFLPHLGLGFIFWAFMAGSLNEYAQAFTSGAHILKQAYLPLSTLIFRVFYRQCLILLHNLIIYPFLVIFCHISINTNTLLVLPGFILVSIIVFHLGLFLAIFCTRYRDMFPIIQSVLSLLFFVTPIIWLETQLTGERARIASYNPFAAFLDLLRSPLIGESPNIHSWNISIFTAVLVCIVSWITLNFTRKKITYWL